MTKEKRIRATHSSFINIGKISIPCHVLEDGTRVISGRGMQNSLGFSKSDSGLALPNFVETKLTSFLSEEAINQLKNPLVFVRVGSGGSVPITHGNDATLLVDICDAIIEASKQKGLLSDTQKRYAAAAEIIIRSVAKVGIIALIDEATGYQEIRDRKALEALLDKYLRKELAAWAKRFPDEFYKEMFRLKGWAWNPTSTARSPLVGKYTNDLVYDRLAPNIVEELQKKNPKNENGNRIHRHHQWLTEDIGHPALAQHLHAVMGLMRASSNWDSFRRLIQRAYPSKGSTLEMDV
jgi:hypothetical protein